MIYEDLIAAIGNTPLIALPRISPDGVRMYGKHEGYNPTGSVKDRIARAMIEAAEKKGLLADDRIVLEPSSGNTGISLALMCKVRGLRLVIVMPEAVSVERRRLLEVHGAEIVLSPGDQGTNGAIRVAESMAKDPKYVMLNQYENEANPLAHEQTTAEEILHDLPELDMFVAGLGTGGTLTGVGRRLKRHNPDVKIVAAEPPAGDLVQGLRSLDEGYIPPILDPSVIDKKYMVASKDAFRATRELFQREGIYAGISAGAALHAAMRAIRQLQPRTVVVPFADEGSRYISTGVHIEEPEDVERKLQGKIWW